MRAALYARVSTQRQAQAQTVEQQMRRLTDHAQQQGWEMRPDQIFRDDGHSGASLRRPGLDRLRDRVAARSLDVVLITAPDRLARNYVHQVLLLEELQGHGCEVRFLERPMSQDPHDQLLLQIRGAVAEYERTLITERMRRGRQRKLEAGLMLPWTRPPFGYRVDPERPRDPAGIRIEEAEAAIVREMFAWYAEEAPSFCSLARLLEQRAIRTSTGLRRWNLASIRALLTNPAYAGRVYGNRWHRRGALERRSATAPRQHSAMSRVDAPRDEWILVAEIPPLVSQEQFDRVQARLVSNRRFARRNNKAHPYLLRGLVSCGLCGLACLARTTAHSYRYYSCTGKLPALFSHREQKCPSRLSPAERLDELVWTDLCELLTHPEQVSQALARAHGGQWLPQELQARQEGLRRGQVSLGQQLERLTEAYLAGVVLLDEYRRRRSDLERRQQQLEEQVTRLEAQADRQKELAGLSRSVAKFSQRVRQGLGHASFEQKRSLMELLIDRVIVTDGEVEIRYVMPTTQPNEQVRFCHLQLDYRARPPESETSDRSRAWLWRLLDGATNACGLRGNGDDQERAGSKHQRQRHQGPGEVHRQAVQRRRLRRGLNPGKDHSRPTPKLCNRTAATLASLAQQVVDQGGDHVLALKGNQGTLHDDVRTFLNDPAHEATARAQTVDADHGRIDTRMATLSTDIAWLQEDHHWPGLTAIGKLTRVRETGAKTTPETAYYLLSTALSAKRFNEIARAHWQVENALHWRLDVIMHEDQDRTRMGNGPNNLAVLRRMALNVMQKDGSKDSLRGKLQRAGWGNAYLSRLLGIF